MEPTGVYWFPVIDLLDERGVWVFLVNACDVKDVHGRHVDEGGEQPPARDNHVSCLVLTVGIRAATSYS
jgi:hypothetical protein